MGATCCAPEAPTANLGPHNPYANISLVDPTSTDYPVGNQSPLLTSQEHKVHFNLDQSNRKDPGMNPTMPSFVSPNPHHSNNFTQMQSIVMTNRISDQSVRTSRFDNTHSIKIGENQSSQYVAVNSPHQPSPNMALRVQLPKPTLQIQARRKKLGVLNYDGDDKGVQLEPYKYIDSGIIYFGQWLNGKPQGRGIIYFPDGSIFEGGFREGKTVGKGRLINKNGHYYEGFVYQNSANGYGVSENNTTRYQGQFLNNIPHGKGVQFSLDGKSKFTGTFNQGLKSQGTLVWGDNNDYTYQGTFGNDIFQGHGILTSPSGVYNGEFRNNRKHGRGQYRWTDGRRYQGNYENDLKSGYGQLFNSNGSSSYKGNWGNDLPNGIGTSFLNGKQVTATWRNGTYQGPA